jgi:hypothetical protein
MKMTKEKFKKAIREEIIDMLSGGDDSTTDQIYALISRANMSVDAREVMMKWMEHTDNPQAIIDYLEGTMNESSVVVDKNTNPTSINDKDPKTVKTAVDTAKKTGKPVTIAEVDEDDDSIYDKEPSAADLKKETGLVKKKEELVKISKYLKAGIDKTKEIIKKDAKDKTEAEKKYLQKMADLTKRKKQLEKSIFKK